MKAELRKTSQRRKYFRVSLSLVVFFFCFLFWLLLSKSLSGKVKARDMGDVAGKEKGIAMVIR